MIVLVLACAGTPDTGTGGDSADTEDTVDTGTDTDVVATCSENQASATWTGTDGVSEVVTASLLDGEEGNPVTMGLSEDGDLAFCGGTWHLAIVVDAVVTIRAEDPSVETVLTGGGAAPAVQVKDGASATITGLVLRDGLHENGRGGTVGCAYGYLELVDVVVEGGIADVGGGVGADSCDVVISGGTISGGYANRGGGVGVIAGSLVIDDTSLWGNACDTDGGAIAVFQAAAVLTGLSVEDNEAGDHGGGVFVYSGSLDIADSTISGNVAIEDGGAIAVSSSSQLELDGATVDGNTALYGGGIYIDNGSEMALTSSVFSDNEAAVQGGGLYHLWGAHSTLEGVTINGNVSAEGGGIWLDVDSTTSGSDCSFAGNVPEDLSTESGAVATLDGVFACSDAGCE